MYAGGRDVHGIGRRAVCRRRGVSVFAGGRDVHGIGRRAVCRRRGVSMFAGGRHQQHRRGAPARRGARTRGRRSSPSRRRSPVVAPRCTIPARSRSTACCAGSSPTSAATASPRPPLARGRRSTFTVVADDESVQVRSCHARAQPGRGAPRRDPPPPCRRHDAASACTAMSSTPRDLDVERADLLGAEPRRATAWTNAGPPMPMVEPAVSMTTSQQPSNDALPAAPADLGVGKALERLIDNGWPVLQGQHSALTRRPGPLPNRGRRR